MKRREALEAYRRSRAAGRLEPRRVARPAATPPRPSRPLVTDPVSHAVQNFETWMAIDKVADLVEYYPFLPTPTQRQKVISWAVAKAREGNLHPLLSIGVEDVDTAVRRHIDRLIDTIPTDLLLGKLAEDRYTIRERRSVAGVLGRCRDPRAGRILASLADHEDARVRESALQALARFPVTAGLQLPIFLRRLEEDPHPDVQLRAAEGLARLGTPEAVAALEKAARREETTPEIQGVLAAFHARRRPKASPDVVSSEPKERKPIPKDLVAKICVILVLACVAGYRLKEPVKRWYIKKFPPPAQTASAPGQ